VFAVALAFRIWHISTANYIDHNGDSYHHWLTSYLTATSNYEHIDYKGDTVNVAWLPLYHYVIAVLMNVFNTYNLNVQHSFNILLGSLTCLLVFALMRNYDSAAPGFAAGLALAVQPWFVDLTTLGISEIMAIFFLVLGVYVFVRGKIAWSVLPVTLAMLVRYEAWVFALALLVIGIVQKRASHRQFLVYLAFCAAVVIGWSLNSWTQTGHFTSWYSIQSMTVRWDRLFTSGVGGIQEYVQMLIEATAGMFVLGLAVGMLKKDRDTQLLFLLAVAFLSMVIFQFYRGTAPFQVRFLSYLFPLTAILSSKAATLPVIASKRTNRRILLSFMVLAIVVVFPLWNQYWILSPTTDQKRLDIHVASEMVAGELLGNTYIGGTVLCDSPTIIYYSNLDPSTFYSTSSLGWYPQTWSKSELATWMRERDIRYLIWQNVSYSASWLLFPELSCGSGLDLDSISFRMLASTSSGFGPIYIYEVTTRSD
jgi:4-amino-4-deoxy-L-arabinose transferase-like glycosyltransferase